MPKYLIQRKFHVGENEMPRVGRRSRQVIEQEFPEITWHHSHVVVDDEGVVKSYCVYEAPSVEVVRLHSRQLGDHVIEEMYEIAGDVSPEDFPLT
jgi:Protein of unknown function (DUF4242)